MTVLPRQVRAAHLAGAPRSYTVEPGKRLKDSWELNADAAYDLSVFGDEQAVLEAHVECRHEIEKAWSLSVANFGKLPVSLQVRDSISDPALGRSVTGTLGGGC